MNFRKIIFWAHLISGLLIGSVILVMAVTGALMAFENQIVDFAERNLQHVEVPAQPVRLKIQELIARASEKNPALMPGGVTLQADPSRSVVVSMGREGGSLYMNPYTGEILGRESKARQFMHSVEDIHRRLAWGETGRSVTGASAFVMLIMVISGIYLWWPNQWTASVLRSIMFFKKGVTGKARDWNWHNVFGFWCSLILLTSTLTGLIMAYSWANNLLFRATGNEPPMQQQRMGGGPGGKPGGGPGGPGRMQGRMDQVKPKVSLDFDILNAAVQKQVPEWNMISFRMPREGAGPVMAMVEEKNSFPQFLRSMVTLEGSTGKVLKWEPASGMNSGKKARTWVKYIHTGEAGGVIGQTLVLTGALGAVMLVWTGFALSWRRFFGNEKSKKVKNSQAV